MQFIYARKSRLLVAKESFPSICKQCGRKHEDLESLSALPLLGKEAVTTGVIREKRRCECSAVLVYYFFTKRERNCAARLYRRVFDMALAKLIAQQWDSDKAREHLKNLSASELLKLLEKKH